MRDGRRTWPSPGTPSWPSLPHPARPPTGRTEKEHQGRPGTRSPGRAGEWSGPVRLSAGLRQKWGHTQDAWTHRAQPALGSRAAGVAVAALPRPPPCSLSGLAVGLCSAGAVGGGLEPPPTQSLFREGLAVLRPLVSAPLPYQGLLAPPSPAGPDPPQYSKPRRKLGFGWVTRTTHVPALLGCSSSRGSQ